MSDYTLLVCPHDTAKNPERWFFLTQYLSTILDAHVSFENYLDFAEFHANLDKADIVYANPQDCVKLNSEFGFIPIFRPAGMFDEVVLIMGEDVEATGIEALQGQKVAGVMDMLPTKIGLSVLDKHGIKPAEMVDNDSWLAVVNNIIQGKIEYGFVYKDTFDGLSPMSKEMVNLLYTSNEQLAFHCLAIGPRLIEKQAILKEKLAGMADDPQDKTILENLEIEQWISIGQEDVDSIRNIITSYG
ncbi:PhnD/SsuA/transferrin family substrate-binding protein [Anaerolineales bacterium HSG24]|nr:PhnD/SsuA/transferrin family substrate-binding protein [Anaerolineales bacterium HSG24]